MIGQLIHDKLITDFSALKFDVTGSNIFTTVKKYYTSGSMTPQNGLIMPDSNQETVEGGSAGNFQTTREYAFRAVAIENIEEADTDSAGSVKYQRLINIQDVILNYLQKEPSNLNAWGNTNDIAIFKIRVRQVLWDTQRSEAGFTAVLHILFGVFLTVIPQNL